MKNMIESLQKLQKAFDQVNKEWEQCEAMDELTQGEYPFQKSFDELNLNVQKWTNQSIKELKNR